MAFCFAIPYEDRFGKHEARKWGETPREAVALLKTALSGRACGEPEIGEPVAIEPQPFGGPLLSEVPTAYLPRGGGSAATPQVVAEAADLVLV